MRSATVISALFHLAAIALIYFGVPRLFDEELSHERVVVVELVPVAEARNLPEHRPKAKPDREVEAAAPSAPPPPPPSPPAPRMQPEPEPAPVLAAAAPPPEEVRAIRLPDEIKRPRRKPKPPPRADPFVSVLKSVERLEDRPSPAPIPEKPAPPVPEADPVEDVLATANTGFRAEMPLSMSEIDNIRYQIQKNWNLPAGALNAHMMRVTLRIELGPDGSVTNVAVVNQGQMRSDPFFRAMAESTVRAVLKTGRIRNLAPEKYHLWHDMQINFDPRDMYG